MENFSFLCYPWSAQRKKKSFFLHLNSKKKMLLRKSLVLRKGRKKNINDKVRKVPVGGANVSKHNTIAFLLRHLSTIHWISLFLPRAIPRTRKKNPPLRWFSFLPSPVFHRPIDVSPPKKTSERGGGGVQVGVRNNLLSDSFIALFAASKYWVICPSLQIESFVVVFFCSFFPSLKKKEKKREKRQIINDEGFLFFLEEAEKNIACWFDSLSRPQACFFAPPPRKILPFLWFEESHSSGQVALEHLRN